MEQLHTIKFEFVSMTTRCVLQLIHHNEQHINHVAQKIYHHTKALEQKYNFFSPNSWLTQTINQRHQPYIELDDEAWKIFQKVSELSHLTQNIFDITIGSIRLPAFLQQPHDQNQYHHQNQHIQQLQQWYQQGKTRQEIIQMYQPALGLNAWKLDEQHHHLVLFDDRTRLDLGGVIKEYAVDEAMNIAKEADCQGLISFGGDLKVFGQKSNGEDYKVGIKNPFNPEQTCLSLTLKNQALTTSGNYERNDNVGQQHFSHIINNHMIHDITNHQDTGNQDNTQRAKIQKVVSVTVVSSDTLTSGVFSTALMVNPNLALPKVDDLGVIQAIIIDSHANLHAISNQHDHH